MIISIHIPKCAGVSFRDTLAKSFNKKVHLDYLDKIDSIEYINKPNPSYGKIKKGAEVIHGHFQADKYINLYPDTKYITWIREPVERIVSHYLFWKRVPDTKNSTCMKMVNGNYSLLEFAAMPEIKNLQSFYFGNLKVNNFSFIGIVEMYGRGINLLNNIVATKLSLNAIHTNNNPNKKNDLYNIDIGTRKKIEKLHKKDMLLYKKVKYLFILKYGIYKLMSDPNQTIRKLFRYQKK